MTEASLPLVSDVSRSSARSSHRESAWLNDWLSFAAILAALGAVGLLIVVAGSRRWFGIGDDLAKSMIDSGTQVAVLPWLGLSPPLL